MPYADVVYLDHAGAGVHSQFQVDSMHKALSTLVLANPHSVGGPSELCTRAIQRARERVLAFFNTSEASYTIVFTVR
jgi:molybdenum cofactor sulfurtransferase